MPTGDVIAGYIVSAAIGGVLTYLTQNYVRLLTEDVAQINDHISDVGHVQTAAVSYWLSVDAHDAPSEKDLRARLLGALEVSKTFRVEAPRLLGCRFTRYKDLDGLLFDLSTGGGFETAMRAQDSNRVVEIMSCCHELRALLRAARRAIFWAH